MSRLLKALAATGAKDTGYDIEQSLQLEKYNAGYLHRTPGSASNRKTWTWSGWVKRAETHGSHIQTLFSADGSSDNCYICFYLDDIYINDYDYDGGGTKWLLITNAKYRDYSAWYHIVFAVDTTQGTAANRLKLYVNGEQVTSFSTETYPAQNYDGYVNSTYAHKVGSAFTGVTNYTLGGSIAEVHFIDGTALAASHFGETDEDTGEWIPKEYNTSSGAYGTNGFYLKFASGAIGTDSSGEGNNYTTVSLDNGDVREDSPTNNFCKMNRLASAFPLYGANNRVVSDGDNKAAYGTFGVTSGKWYWEVYVRDWISGGGHFVGVGSGSDVVSGAAWYSAGFVGISTFNGDKYSNGLSPSASYIGSAYADNDVVNVALDMDAGKLYIGKNGDYAGDANNDPADGEGNFIDGSYPLPSGHLMPIVGRGGSYDETYELNFGDNQTIDGLVTAYTNADGNGYGLFKYAPPSGFLALCSKNMADPAVKDGGKHFNTVLYTGSGADNKAVTGVGFQPDMTWIMARATYVWTLIHDAVRGAGERLYTQATAAEVDESSNFKSFDSDGFTLGPPGNSYNASTQAFAAWNWKAAGSGSSNSAGDITSTVSANNDAGISIVTYTGNRTNAGVSTVGHGLSVAPKVVLTKSRSNATHWWMQHAATSTASKMLRLETTDGETDKSSNGTLSRPTSTVFGTNWTDGIGTNSHTHVAYCFAEVEGFSKFDSYEGNNSTDGPFIYTGFRPAWLMIKYVDGTGESWWVLDSKRNSWNPTGKVHWPNLTASSYDYGEFIDFVANGFKIKATNQGINNANTYSYMAFAESPFKYANAR